MVLEEALGKAGVRYDLGLLMPVRIRHDYYSHTAQVGQEILEFVRGPQADARHAEDTFRPVLPYDRAEDGIGLQAAFDPEVDPFGVAPAGRCHRVHVQAAG